MDQKYCKLCKGHAYDPIMLVCSHYLCYQCGLKIQVHDNTSLIQGKFRIQCPHCKRQTYTYEIQNLLLDNKELNLITDSSELDKEQLHESQLSHNALVQQDPIFQRRVSKIIDRHDLNFQVLNNEQSNIVYKEPCIKQIKGLNMTPTNHTQQMLMHQSKKNPSSEKVSPSRITNTISTPHQKQRKSSHVYQFDSSLIVDERNQLNHTENLKACFEPIKVTSSAVSTPCSTPFNLNFGTSHTTNKDSHSRQSNDLTNKTYNKLVERMSHVSNEQSFFKLDQSRQNLEKGKENNQQDSSFVIQKKTQTSQPFNPSTKHKRSSTGLPVQSTGVLVQQQLHTQENDQVQIIQFYFQMLQKNLQKVEADILQKLQKNKTIDTNFLYSRLKRISQKLHSKNEDDLIQQIRVIQELRVELSNANYNQKRMHSKPLFNEEQEQKTPQNVQYLVFDNPKSAEPRQYNKNSPQQMYLQSKLL